MKCHGNRYCLSWIRPAIPSSSRWPVSSPTEPVLASLRETPPPAGGMEIYRAEGRHPSRQRNAAETRSRGNILVFLDNDCALDVGYWKELRRSWPGLKCKSWAARPCCVRKPRVGGDFHALLTHTLIVGTVSSRYAPGAVSRGDPDRPHPLQSCGSTAHLRENWSAFQASSIPARKTNGSIALTRPGVGAYY